MDVTTELLGKAVYALGIGVLVGLERSVFDQEAETADADGAGGSNGPEGTSPQQPSLPSAAPTDADAQASEEDSQQEGGEPSGVRTFSTFSLVGFSAAVVNTQISFAGPVILAGLIALVIALYRHTLVKSPGMTTEAAAIGTAVLGAMCHSQPQLAAVLAVILTGILSTKQFMRETVGKMRRIEVIDTLKFLVIILIVVPLLPNRALDPFGAINPYKIGWLVVLISGISYVGYFLTRILGAQKGLGLTGLLGGLTSSTAVTAAMAEESKAAPGLKSICAFATVVANATSFLRVLVMVTILDLSLAKQLAWSLGGMAATAIIAATLLWFAASRDNVTETKEREGQVKLKNPFALSPALKFAAFFVLIIFVSKVAREQLGNAGIYLAAAFSGLADVDAITLSCAEQAGSGTIPASVAVLAITIAVVSNALVKSGIAIFTGGKEFGRLTALALGSAVAVGLFLAGM